jgi:hypothetical protein
MLLVESGFKHHNRHFLRTSPNEGSTSFIICTSLNPFYQRITFYKIGFHLVEQLTQKILKVDNDRRQVMWKYKAK